MKLLPQTSPFYLYDVPNHNELKINILDAIKSMGVHSLIEKDQQISNSDWHLSVDFKRPYFAYIHHALEKHIAEVIKFAGIPQGTPLRLSNYWFQQYKKGDFHNWHIHNGFTFSNVYYVDLPDGASKTSFISSGVEFEIDVKEGQILTFPSCFLHCSKPNETAVKTIISFNY